MIKKHIRSEWEKISKLAIYRLKRERQNRELMADFA